MGISFFKILMAYNLNLYNNIRNNIFKEETPAMHKRIKKLTEIYIILKKNLKKGRARDARAPWRIHETCEQGQ